MKFRSNCKTGNSDTDMKKCRPNIHNFVVTLAAVTGNMIMCWKENGWFWGKGRWKFDSICTFSP